MSLTVVAVYRLFWQQATDTSGTPVLDLAPTESLQPALSNVLRQGYEADGSDLMR